MGDASLLWLRSKEDHPMDTNFITVQPCFKTKHATYRKLF